MTEFAGLLRERMTLERAIGVSDGAGGTIAGWARLGEIWAGITADRPGPGVEAERRSRRARYRVILREREDVTLSCRLLWRRGSLGIIGITRDPATPGQIELLVEEWEL